MIKKKSKVLIPNSDRPFEVLRLSVKFIVVKPLEPTLMEKISDMIYYVDIDKVKEFKND